MTASRPCTAPASCPRPAYGPAELFPAPAATLRRSCVLAAAGRPCLHTASTCGLITHQELDHGRLHAKALSDAVRRTLFAQLRQGVQKDHEESCPIPLTTYVLKRMLKPLHHGAPETGRCGGVRGTRTCPASPGVHILRSHLRDGFHATRQARAVGPSAGGPWQDISTAIRSRPRQCARTGCTGAIGNRADSEWCADRAATACQGAQVSSPDL